jgi:iron(II)-dependent oxidoreductase
VSTVQACPPVQVAGAGDAAPALAALAEARARTLALIAHLGPAQLERVHSPIMGPLVWDLAHIAAYEDLWLCHRHGGLELLRPELARLYDAFETPRAQRRPERTRMLDTRAAISYLEEVAERTRAVLERRGPGDWSLVELVVRHELQHTETMRQAMNLAGLLPDGEPPRLLAGSPGASAEWVEVAGGSFAMGAEEGAGAERFAYDNERPRHERRVEAFAIGRAPLRNADWREFREAGGYERRQWWSAEGWAWLRTGDAGDPAGDRLAAGRDADPEACLCHVAFFEAEALARSRGARLPTEAEWERAARAPGVLAGSGVVWEWTSSVFSGYPGFRAHPYREYSEVFFDRGYRVLRGGSWATARRVATSSFRNWDLPERRQIFAGARLARDLPRAP